MTVADQTVARLREIALERARAVIAEPHRLDLCERFALAIERLLRTRAAMRTLVLAVVLAAVGCSVPEPLNPEVDPPAGVLDALAIAVQELSYRLPDAEELVDVDLPPIRWFDPGPTGCLDFGDHHGGCILGVYQVTSFDREIQVVVQPFIHRSALAHELAHWALDETTGDFDRDHRSPAAWEAVREINEYLDRAGL